MKQTFIIFFLIVLIGCNSQKNNKSNNLIDFQKYIESLDQVPLPMEYSLTGKFPSLSHNYDTVGFMKYKHVWTSKPLGIVFKNEENVVTIELSIGDNGLVPFFISYDMNGNKIDSLGPFVKSGWDLGYEAFEYLTIRNDRTIMVTDTVKNWKLNEAETDIIEDSLTITTDTVFYKITDQGKIIMNGK